MMPLFDVPGFIVAGGGGDNFPLLAKRKKFKWFPQF